VAFVAAAIGLGCSLIMAVTPAISLPGGPGDDPVYPAPPGYLLPWAGGEIHSVTQGEDTSFTHNGLAAYAIDFDLSYETVVAARSGRVAMVREDSNVGGCSSFYSASANYVVIDHGDGSSGLYMHLAYNSVEVEVGQTVRQGEPVGISGETGVTCSGETGLEPGAHLHFQVQPFVEGKYFTQSQPIAFDDIPSNEGVAAYGESYVSGNFGPGKPQKIQLTPYRVPRVFNPQARPLHPEIVQAENPTPTAVPPPADTPTPTKTPVPLAEWSITPETETPYPTETPTPIPTDTPVPPPPPPSNTPIPTPVPPTDTPVPPPPTDTPTVEAQGEPTP
jgi:murein DD-endopeptidase MepM/ murein hydrolase activator NlpD